MRVGVYKNGSFAKWFLKLDSLTARKVTIEIEKLVNGNEQNCKRLPGNISEIKMRSGHRAYFGTDHQVDTHVFLAGSMKDDQSRVINRAQKYWKQYKVEKNIGMPNLIQPVPAPKGRRL